MDCRLFFLHKICAFVKWNAYGKLKNKEELSFQCKIQNAWENPVEAIICPKVQHKFLNKYLRNGK